MAKRGRQVHQDVAAIRDAANRGQELTDSRGRSVVEEAGATSSTEAGSAPAFTTETTPTTGTARPRGGNRRATVSGFTQGVEAHVKAANLMDFASKLRSTATEKLPGEEGFGEEEGPVKAADWYSTPEERERRDRDAREAAEAPLTKSTTTPLVIDVNKAREDRRQRQADDAEREATAGSGKASTEEVGSLFMPSAKEVAKPKMGELETEGWYSEKDLENVNEPSATLKRLGQTIAGHVMNSAELIAHNLPGAYKEEYGLAAKTVSQLQHHLGQMSFLGNYGGEKPNDTLTWRDATQKTAGHGSGTPPGLQLADQISNKDSSILSEKDNFNPSDVMGHAHMAAKLISTLSSWLEQQHKGERSPHPEAMQTNPPGPEVRRTFPGEPGDPWVTPNLGKGFVNATPKELTYGSTATTYGEAAHQAVFRMGLLRNDPTTVRRALGSSTEDIASEGSVSNLGSVPWSGVTFKQQYRSIPTSTPRRGFAGTGLGQGITIQTPARQRIEQEARQHFDDNNPTEERPQPPLGTNYDKDEFAKKDAEWQAKDDERTAKLDQAGVHKDPVGYLARAGYRPGEYVAARGKIVSKTYEAARAEADRRAAAAALIPQKISDAPMADANYDPTAATRRPRQARLGSPNSTKAEWIDLPDPVPLTKEEVAARKTQVEKFAAERVQKEEAKAAGRREARNHYITNNPAPQLDSKWTDVPAGKAAIIPDDVLLAHQDKLDRWSKRVSKVTADPDTYWSEVAAGKHQPKPKAEKPKAEPKPPAMTAAEKRLLAFKSQIGQ